VLEQVGLVKQAQDPSFLRGKLMLNFKIRTFASFTFVTFNIVLWWILVLLFKNYKHLWYQPKDM